MEKIINTDLIENFIKERGISKIKFCEMCRISTGTLNKIYSNSTSLGIIQPFKIARILKVQICDLFIKRKLEY